MTVDAASGLVTWSPTESSPAEARVVLEVYDSLGGRAGQEFVIAVAGGNRPPVFAALPEVVNGVEGQLLEIAVRASDPDGDLLALWANGLPPGAVLDSDRRLLVWTPGFQQAGVYENVRFVASDGFAQSEVALRIVIAPVNQPPVVAPLIGRAVSEGEALRIAIQASDPEGGPLLFASSLLPAGAVLNPATGVLTWSPAFYQAGVYHVPLTVSDGQSVTTQQLTLTVLNENARPQFGGLTAFEVEEDQSLEFRAFAFDPDNPGFVPLWRLFDGSLAGLEGTLPSVSYVVSGLPSWATFDPQTAIFKGKPDFDDCADVHGAIHGYRRRQRHGCASIGVGYGFDPGNR